MGKKVKYLTATIAVNNMDKYGGQLTIVSIKEKSALATLLNNDSYSASDVVESVYGIDMPIQLTKAASDALASSIGITDSIIISGLRPTARNNRHEIISDVAV